MTPEVEVVIKAIEAGKKDTATKLDEIKAAATAEVKVIADELDKVKGIVAKLDEQKGMPKPDEAKVLSFDQVLAKQITENWDSIAKIKESKGNRATFEMSKAMDYSTNFSTADVSVSQLRQGIVELPQRMIHLRNLLDSNGRMNTRDFVYVRETAEGGTVAPWATGNKAEVTSSFEEVSAPSRDIAGFVQIPVAMLEDVEGLTAFLQRRLISRYLKAEDLAVMYGANDTAPNFTGLTVAATGSVSASLKIIDKIVLTLADLEGSEYAPNGILMHPRNFYELTLNQTSADEYTYPVVFNALSGQLTIAGIPVIKSTAVNVNNMLIGDWTNGAQLITRKAPIVEFFYEHGTNVITNQVTVRVEGRVALPIYHPAAWAYGATGTFS